MTPRHNADVKAGGAGSMSISWRNNVAGPSSTTPSSAQSSKLSSSTVVSVNTGVPGALGARIADPCRLGTSPVLQEDGWSDHRDEQDECTHLSL
jgi:hypothetical protein